VRESLVYAPDALVELPARTLGGKAKGLLRLDRAGVRVPPFRVISAERAASRPWETDAAASQELQACFHALNTPPFQGIAVRSSADIEDCAGASGAGLFETVFVDRADDLVMALNRVLDSGLRPFPEGYERRSRRTAPRMAVILQSRVVPRLAGILFSANPAAALPDEGYMEVITGEGRSLAGGSCNPSRFRLDLARRRVAQAVPGPDGPPDLDAGVAETLIVTLLDLERIFDRALDIEWAMDASGIWFLQARSITALQPHSSLRPPVCATSWFFDQRFTEPIHPLTRTTLLPLIARVAIREALEMRHCVMTKPLLYFYAGQAYIAHDTYRAMLGGAPRWLLTPDLQQLFPKHCFCPPGGAAHGSFLDYAWCALTAVIRNRRDVFLNIRAWDRFAAELPSRIAEIMAVPREDTAVWRAQWEALDRLTEQFLRLHRWSYLWANYLYRVFRLLLSVVPGNIRNHLERRLQTSLRLPTAEANAALAQVLKLRPEDPAWDEFVSQYGHRSASLDYAVPTWRERAVTSKLRRDYAGITGIETRPLPYAPHAGGFHPLRRFLELREAQRFEWERILAAQRQLLIEAAARLQDQGVLRNAGDIWFLEWNEFINLLENGGQAPESIIGTRRHTHYLETCLRRPSFVGPDRREEAAAGSPIGTVLRGLGASPGFVRGRALILSRPQEFPRAFEGPAIAVLTALDPAWTVLFPRVQGLVIERGGLLSHAAILAREYGVPLVIGIPDATLRVRTGQDLGIDGSRGTVTIFTNGAPE